MSALPRVVETTRERVTKEFDNLGPELCLSWISTELERNNPELLDMARRCASDVAPEGTDPAKILLGFAMFYRLLLAQGETPQTPTEKSGQKSSASDCIVHYLDPQKGRHGMRLNPLPRVTPEVRDALVQQIDDQSPEVFTVAALEDLDFHNPQLLHMAHNFAMRFTDYLGIMQGFALLYMALTLQADADREEMQ
jgi:hypothetical protein